MAHTSTPAHRPLYHDRTVDGQRVVTPTGRYLYSAEYSAQADRVATAAEAKPRNSDA